MAKRARFSAVVKDVSLSLTSTLRSDCEKHLIHLVLRGDDLGAGFVPALIHDQVGELGRHVDVGASSEPPTIFPRSPVPAAPDRRRQRIDPQRVLVIRDGDQGVGIADGGDRDLRDRDLLAVGIAGDQCRRRFEA